MTNRRVVITGIGAITPIGSGSDGLWAGVQQGKSAVQTVDRFDPSPFRSHLAAQVNDFNPLAYMDEKRERRLDRFAQFALAASKQAVTAAGLDLDEQKRESAGLYIGSALGGIAYAEEQHRRYLEDGPNAVSPTLAVAVFGGAAPTNVALEFGWHGPNMSSANGCASGAIAIGEAFRMIRRGEAPVMLAGGVEAPLGALVYGAFAIIRAMSSRNDDPATASRPFDRDRDGFVMSEGATILLLEDAEFAAARGAQPIAEIVGYATTTDAYHMTAPLPNGTQATRCMQLALKDACLPPEAIGYVNAHGSSTPLNDGTEAQAIRAALGKAADNAPVSGTKGLTGHLLGATGAVEAAICARSLQAGWLPPCANLFNPDPLVDLDLICGEGRHRAVQYILSNSFGFGGINASLVLAKV